MKLTLNCIISTLFTIISAGTVVVAQGNGHSDLTSFVTVTQTATTTQTILAFGGMMQRLIVSMDNGSGLTFTTTTDLLTATQLVTLATSTGLNCPTVTMYLEQEMAEDFKLNKLIKLPRAESMDNEELIQNLLKFAALPNHI